MSQKVMEKIKNIKNIGNIKELYTKQTPKRKKLILAALIGVIVIPIVAMTLLYKSGSQYKEIFPDMSKEESKQVVATLGEMGVECKSSVDGKVFVPSTSYDKTILTLASKGFPKSTLSYDIFGKTGFTSTDMEKWQYLVFQLQDRLSATINSINGVESSIVTLNMSKNEGYLIDKYKQKNSASVLINKTSGGEITSEQVGAIKALVSSSVPNISKENVAVVDAQTGIALKENEIDSKNGVNLQQLGFEQEVEQRIVDKIRNILTLAYGSENVRVSATVSLDYDQMVTKQKQYVPEQDGGNVKNSLEKKYAFDKKDFASGIAGEEDNTDVPVYVDQDQDGAPEYIDYSTSIDYLVSYIETQIQKDAAEIKDASVAVALKITNLTEQTKESMIDSISKATGISKDKISVNNFNYDMEKPAENMTPGIFASIPIPLIIAIAVVSLFVLLIIIYVIVKIASKRKNKEENLLTLEEQKQQEMRNKLDEEARKLKEAKQKERTQEEQVIDDVQDFANQHPQITASLIRAWLRGED